MKDIKSKTPAELAAELAAMGLPRYRAGQVFRWISRGAVFSEMTDLPKPLREALAAEYFLEKPSVARKQLSQLDGTIKYLWRFSDGECVESVLMKYHYGATICVSTQVGCAMGCAFCASTVGGRVRNLTAGEILDQVIFTQLDSEQKISNIVLMGIGEPLDNYDAVSRFLELVNDPDGLNVGMRHISLSTCGLVPMIDRLASERSQLTLSVSLHSADEETRAKIMPVSRRYPLSELFPACERYFKATGRRVSFEYAMIDGLNDSPAAADLLIKRLRGTGSHINLIPLNKTDRGLTPSPRARIEAFKKRLEGAGLNVTVRRSLGGDIDASCGQLRKGHEKL